MLLESNHDREIAADGPYPGASSNGILSPSVTLSNGGCGGVSKHDYDGHATHVILAHLSESNNLPSLSVTADARAGRQDEPFPNLLLVRRSMSRLFSC